MRAFFTEPPRIAFTRIEGVTPPLPIDRPPPIHPLRLTLDDIDRIIEYARRLEPPDLGEMRIRQTRGLAAVASRVFRNAPD